MKAFDACYAYTRKLGGFGVGRQLKTAAALTVVRSMLPRQDVRRRRGASFARPTSRVRSVRFVFNTLFVFVAALGSAARPYNVRHRCCYVQSSAGKKKDKQSMKRGKSMGLFWTKAVVVVEGVESFDVRTTQRTRGVKSEKRRRSKTTVNSPSSSWPSITSSYPMISRRSRPRSSWPTRASSRSSRSRRPAARSCPSGGRCAPRRPRGSSRGRRAGP